MSGNVRYLAARARLTGSVGPGDATAFTAMDPTVWRLVDRSAGDRRLIVLATASDHPLSSDDPHAASLARTRTKTLLAVLAASRVDEADHPWPGKEVTVDDVLRLLGGVRITDGVRRHYLSSFADLAVTGFVELLDHPPGIPVAAATRVRVGATVAAWEGPWLDELAEMTERVAARDGRGDVDA